MISYYGIIFRMRSAAARQPKPQKIYESIHLVINGHRTLENNLSSTTVAKCSHRFVKTD